MDRLAPPMPATPLPEPPPLKTSSQAVDRLFWYLLGRAPSPAERQTAEVELSDAGHPDRPSAEALADLLWAILMKPEFQFVY